MKGRNFGLSLLRSVMFGHIWLGAGAFAQVWLTFCLAPFSSNVGVAAAAGLATISAYGFMRLAGISDEMDSPGHLVWVQQHRRAVQVLVMVCGVVSAALLLPLAHDAWWFALLLGPAIALYIVPFSKGGRGLRYVPFLKVFLIAIVWSGVVTIFPFAAYGLEGHYMLPAIAFERTCFLLAITLPFDVRDMHADDPARTLPHMFGIRTTKALALVFLVISLTVLLHVPAVAHSQGAVAGAIAGYLVTAILILLSTPGRDVLYYNLLLDGTLILVPLLIVIGMQVSC